MNDCTLEKETQESRISEAGGLMDNKDSASQLIFSATKKMLRPSDDTLFVVRLMARVLSPAY
jgi:hypothetical protein